MNEEWEDKKQYSSIVNHFVGHKLSLLESVLITPFSNFFFFFNFLQLYK